MVREERIGVEEEVGDNNFIACPQRVLVIRYIKAPWAANKLETYA